MLLKNPTLKAERCYSDPDSYVRDDGSEVLYGEDWRQRVEELRERSKGRCEQLIGVDEDGEEVYCSNDATDPHHIVPRSNYRDDRLPNLKHICRRCHIMLDPRKIGGRK